MESCAGCVVCLPLQVHSSVSILLSAQEANGHEPPQWAPLPAGCTWVLLKKKLLLLFLEPL